MCLWEGETVMEQSKLDRINELARKSRTEGLTPEETEEQQKLRSEYIASFRRSLQATLDTVYVEEKNGEPVKLQRKTPPLS